MAFSAGTGGRMRAGQRRRAVSVAGTGEAHLAGRARTWYNCPTADRPPQYPSGVIALGRRSWVGAPR